MPEPSRALPADPVPHLGAEVVLLQLAALPQVPAAHRVVQAPGPEPSAVVGNVDAAGTVRVALELPAGRRAQATVVGRDPPTPLLRPPPAYEPRGRRPRT